MYIAIAGNIGSGKTTLTQILTKRYDAKCYLEECDNPYIGDFYEDMNRWAFNLQISFLGSRIQQTMGMISDCKSGVIFQDRTIYEDAHIFADNLHEMGLMATRDIETYMKIFRLVRCSSWIRIMRISCRIRTCWRRSARGSMRSRPENAEDDAACEIRRTGSVRPG